MYFNSAHNISVKYYISSKGRGPSDLRGGGGGGGGGGQFTKKKIVQGKIVREKSCKSANTKKNPSIGHKNLAVPSYQNRILHTKNRLPTPLPEDLMVRP